MNQLTLSARTLYRMRAARADEQGITLNLVVGQNAVGADADALVKVLAAALKDAVPDAIATWVERVDAVETTLEQPDFDSYRQALSAYQEERHASHEAAMAAKAEQDREIAERRAEEARQAAAQSEWDFQAALGERHQKPQADAQQVAAVVAALREQGVIG